jgi:hypothetical protein
VQRGSRFEADAQVVAAKTDCRRRSEGDACGCQFKITNDGWRRGWRGWEDDDFGLALVVAIKREDSIKT